MIAIQGPGRLATLAVVAMLLASSQLRAAESDPLWRWDELSKRTMAIAMDMVAIRLGVAGNDQPTADCIDTVKDAAREIADEVAKVDALEGLRMEMIDKRDEVSVSTVSKSFIHEAQGVLAVERREVDRASGQCPSVAIVQTKSRDLIQMMDDASTQLEIAAVANK